MSLSQQTRRRLPNIKAGLLIGLNYEQIGAKCGVTERTIDRDVHKWLQTGDFETWIKQEWVRLHNIIIHSDPTEAYRQVSKIMGRMVTRKVESKHTEEIRNINLSWIMDESNTEDKVSPARRAESLSQQ